MWPRQPRLAHRFPKEVGAAHLDSAPEVAQDTACYRARVVKDASTDSTGRAQAEVEDTADALLCAVMQVHIRIKTPVWVKMVRMGNVARNLFATLQCAVEQYYVEYMCRSVCCWRGDDRKPFHACTLYVHGTPLQNRAWALLKPCSSRWAAVITCRGACRVGSRVLS